MCPHSRGWGDERCQGQRPSQRPTVSQLGARGWGDASTEDHPQAGLEPTEGCHARGCASSQRKDTDAAGSGGARGRTWGALTSGPPWSRPSEVGSVTVLNLCAAAAQGVSPGRQAEPGAHSYTWLGWGRPPRAEFFPVDARTALHRGSPAQRGSGPCALHPSAVTMSITPCDVPACSPGPGAWGSVCVCCQLRTF